MERQSNDLQEIYMICNILLIQTAFFFLIFLLWIEISYAVTSHFNYFKGGILGGFCREQSK